MALQGLSVLMRMGESNVENIKSRVQQLDVSRFIDEIVNLDENMCIESLSDKVIELKVDSDRFNQSLEKVKSEKVFT